LESESILINLAGNANEQDPRKQTPLRSNKSSNAYLK
jgi:hypothetical protein